MNKLLRYIFFLLIVKPIVFFLLGVNAHHRNRLPKKGPAVLVANHNSHLDTLILMSLFPLKMLPQIHPVAAADYFLSNPVLAWFSKNIIGIIPVKRNNGDKTSNPLETVYNALNEDAIVIFYPEGTRGEPEHLAKFRSGIAYLASQNPTVDIYPICLYGSGKALPKGEALLVPFVVDITIDEPIRWNGDKEAFVKNLEDRYTNYLANKQMHDDIASY